MRSRGKLRSYKKSIKDAHGKVWAYVGEIDTKGRATGVGVAKDKLGYLKRGTFINDKFEGIGVYMGLGERFEGEFADDMQHGKITKYSFGNIYNEIYDKGQFKEYINITTEHD